MYPTQAFFDSYISTAPENESIGVVLIIFGVAAVFIVYDYISNHRLRALSSFAKVASRMIDDVRAFLVFVWERSMHAPA